DELIDPAIEHGLRVAGLHAGAEVFHHAVGVEHVGANLVAPACLHVITLEPRSLLFAPLDFDLEQLRLEYEHGALAVSPLRPLVLTGDHDTRWQMRNAHSG